MKKLFLVASVLLFCAGTALAATPEKALQLLETGNQKHVMEQTLADGGKLVVVVDSSVTADPATIFGIATDKLAVLKPEASLAEVLGSPLVVVLGTEETAMWNTYAAAVQGTPEIILDVLKGTTAVVGAILDPETGKVNVLGAHPDLFVLAGKYLHAGDAPAETVAAAAGAEESHVETAEGHQTETAVEKAEEHHADAGEAAEEHVAEAGAHGEAVHGENGGGVGATGILLFIIALVGTVVFMDKTMWQ